MYELVSDPDVVEQVAELPVAALQAYAEVLDALRLAPWNGPPQHRAHPEGSVRQWLFGPEGAGRVVYLILERDREVHLLLVQWLL